MTLRQRFKCPQEHPSRINIKKTTSRQSTVKTVEEKILKATRKTEPLPTKRKL